MAVTTVTLTQPENNSANTAAIVTWGSNISSLFSGAGLVKTSDTGQINWGTASPAYATSPAVTLMGYEVWRFADSLQSTKPIFVRVDYYQVRTSGHNYFYILVRVGVSTNGAGTLTGTLTDGLILSPISGTSGSNSPYSGSPSAWSSGDGSYLTLAIAPLVSGAVAVNGGSGVFHLDRTRDSSGVITGEGATMGWCGYGNQTATTAADGAAATGYFDVFSFTTVALLSLGTTTASTGVTLPGCVPVSLTSGSTIGMYAPPIYANGKILPASLASLAYWGADIAQGSTVTLTTSGATHTYYCLGPNFALADRVGGSTTASLALRYE